MAGDAVYINKLVPGKEILTEEEKYTLQFKSPFGTHCTFACGKEQMLEVFNKYGITPQWKYWEKTQKIKKDGTTYDKLVEVDCDTEKKPKEAT